jgi:hypothetical protein
MHCIDMSSLIDPPEVFSSIKDRMENVVVKSRLKAEAAPRFKCNSVRAAISAC